jgi:hypothetical protein
MSSGRSVQLTFRMTRPLKRPMRVAQRTPERDQFVRESSPAECQAAAESLIAAAQWTRSVRRVTGGPDLRLVHVNCPVATFEASVSSPRPPGAGQAQMRLECSVEAQHRGTTSAAEIGRKPFVVASKLYGWVIHGSGASSLRLAMGLTTILTTIWVCPPKPVTVQNPYLQGKSDVRWTCSDALPMSGSSRGREFKSRQPDRHAQPHRASQVPGSSSKDVSLAGRPLRRGPLEPSRAPRP